MSDWDLDRAHRHCRKNRSELIASAHCGCFYCGAIFAPAAIAEWINTRAPDAEWEARCPKCGIDAVIGDVSGYPIEKPFLDAMHGRWFERSIPHSEVMKRIRSKR